MSDQDWLTERFEQQRPRLRAVAYRMLGSTSEADDAIQDTWLRVSRANTADVDNLAAWLTTILARVCLNALRSRAQRREVALEFMMPDPILDRDGGDNPEQEAQMADSVGIALLVVLETLTPSERLAFVLHDMFAVSFDEIGGMIERTPEATRQLASRARRRVRGRAPTPDPDIARQREVVDAFFAAARNGSFESLIAILHPDVVFRAEGLGPTPFVLSGAETVARNARMFGPNSPTFRPALVNGSAGVLLVEDGQLKSITGFTVAGGRIAAIDVLADPDRLSSYNLSFLERS
ncbi:sigma-70 family RNA polymerase sigma factor [Subtercola lobariae]|uniref:DNA-directed RNA polymerase sigma-70 factor n=1 Tax=Subtercola lobariae TaxID=1588641 RepID=A0A917EVP0_9MICO|nr:sigma-70 family RNA polymerase sigma factor [Subtercola lobariae]GGF23089.1 DNA-directed RNA polymerase sigma-70 factor [Subtercola lobariae]